MVQISAGRLINTVQGLTCSSCGHRLDAQVTFLRGMPAMDPWPIVVLLLIYFAVGALVLGLVLHLSERQPRTEPHAPQVDDRPQKARTSSEPRPRPNSSSVLFGVSAQSVRLIQDYGAVMEQYAGYCIISERVLPSRPEAIEQALISAIKANPGSDGRSALEVGLVSLAYFLPDPDGSRGMQIQESILGLRSDGSSRTDPGALSGLMDDADADDLPRLGELVAARSTKMLDIIEGLARTHPRSLPESGRSSGRPEHKVSVQAPKPLASRRVPVQSSNISSVGYDGSTKTLQVEFRDQTVYEYDGVPEDVYDGLLAASSPGMYFHRAVRGRFPYRRIQ